jgi:hypothetical protein
VANLCCDMHRYAKWRIATRLLQLFRLEHTFYIWETVMRTYLHAGFARK